jgi:Dyp-type peroxidase family
LDASECEPLGHREASFRDRSSDRGVTYVTAEARTIGVDRGRPTLGRRSAADERERLQRMIWTKGEDREAAMIPFDETKYPTSKRVGVVTEVTLITPIKRGRVEGEYRTYRERLQTVLDDVQRREFQGLPTPVSLIRQIHFARWVIIDRPGRPAELLFTSNFDGEMKSYFRSFALQLTSDIDAVWENCEGYPGAKDFDRLWQYVKRHQINTSTFYCAYPNLTMPEILKLQELKQDFDDFVRDTGAAAPQALGAFLNHAYKCKPPQAPEQPPQPPGSRKAPEPRLSDIQSNILGSPPWSRIAYRFLTIVDPQAFREGLTRLLEASGGVDFVSAEPFARRKELNAPRLKRALNIAFSWTGLERLGLAKEHLDSMPLAFRQGMAERAAILGDVGQSAPNTWQGMLGRKDIHVLIAAYCTDDDVEAYWQEIERSLGPDPGCRVIHEELGARIPCEGGACEPFGFRDGVGQPEIEGGGRPQPGSKKSVIAAGEFILGYGDVDGNDQIAAKLVGAPFRSLCANGTYMVFRKIEQDVDRFREDVAAFRTRAGAGDVATRFVGRRRDGTSLAVQKADACRDPDDFDYANDPNGEKCPFASHARRTNPRNAESRRHRIIRRGIPYENGGKKGMLFVCLNARIDAQFEFLQSEWCKKGDFLGSFTEVRDPIVGGGGTFVDPTQPFPFSLRSYVTVRGGEYFFVPGIAALGRIANGGFNEPSIAKVKTKDAPPKTANRAPSDESFDPIAHANRSLAIGLLQTRSIEQKRVAWASGKQQAVYYVACRDHVLEILKDDVRFTSGQYASKLERLLDGYDHSRWLRPGEGRALDQGLFRSFMLGMTSENPEKRARLQLLKDALGASNVEAVRKQIGNDVGPIAKAVVDAAISVGRETGGLDIVNLIAYRAPLACAVRHLGFPNLAGFSEAYKALYFERASFTEARDLGFIDQFPKGEDQLKLPPELFALVHSIAIFLLIDQYDTLSALGFARVAVAELLDRLADEVLAEEERIAKGDPSATLLSRLLRRGTDEVDPATFRVRVGMIIAELVAGSVDTTARGITNVVDCLLSNSDALQGARDAVKSGNDSTLDAIILEALRLNPVADLIVRECPNGAELALKSGPFRFEPGSRIFLIPGAAMQDPGDSPLPSNLDLRTFVLDQTPGVQRALDPIRRLGFGDGAHGCLGTETALAEIREVVKQLVALSNLRRATGPTGEKQEHFSLPVSLEIRFDP